MNQVCERAFDSPRLHHSKTSGEFCTSPEVLFFQGKGSTWHRENSAPPRAFPRVFSHLSPTAPALLALAVLAAGCAANPPFEDVPAQGPALMEVTVTSRIADAATVRGICVMKARESGVKIVAHPTHPACSWTEGGRRMILWTRPGSFNDEPALVPAGHELLHHHNLIDHR
jgi:hypothetical protein